jgi:serine protease inhibitor
VIADRSFMHVINDRPSGVPLFIDQVLQPVAENLSDLA